MHESAPAFDSLPKIIRKIPKRCFDRSASRSTFYLVRDLLLAAALVWAILAAPYAVLGPVLAVLLGCVFTGLFVIGHDAGHRSYSYSEPLNNLIGHLTMAPLLWPFHVWRLSHDHHHRWTHHAVHEIAWKPLTTAEYSALSPLKRHAYRLSRTALFFLASTLFQFYFVRDAVSGKFFAPKDARALKFSLRLTLAFGLVYVAATFAAGGIYGFFCLFVIPQTVFHFWLSTFTLLHHTSPENRLLADTEWTPERAQLSLSVQVNYPGPVDWLTHDIAWHVPHHVCVGIPHYHLREAHRALKAAYPGDVQEHRFTWRYLSAILNQCHLVETTSKDGLGWRTAANGTPLERLPKAV